MINIELTAHIINGNVTFPYQNEVENLALETVGTSEDIYFEKIPITKDLYIKYSSKKKHWVLKQNVERHKRDSKKINSYEKETFRFCTGIVIK